MELECESGSKIPIEPGSDTQIGRELGLGFGPSATDRTVSRRHLSLRPIDDPADKFRVGFDVTGKNPIWVCFSNGGDRRIYKNSEKGELRIGDKLSLSIKKPSFWVVKRRGGENEEDEERKRVLAAVARREMRTLERREKEDVSRGGDGDGDGDGEEIGAVDVSQIDPVKEFGFLVKGHEFDQYPKKRIIAAKNWNWFVEEPSENSDDDDAIAGATLSKRKEGMTRKKKKGGADDDEEWTGESEDEKEDVAVREGSSKRRHKHSTRSKDLKIPRNDAAGARNPAPRKDSEVCVSEVEEEDEEDETLGGFVVDDDDEEEEVVEDEESEDEFDDEDE